MEIPARLTERIVEVMIESRCEITRAAVGAGGHVREAARMELRHRVEDVLAGVLEDL